MVYTMLKLIMSVVVLCVMRSVCIPNCQLSSTVIWVNNCFEVADVNGLNFCLLNDIKLVGFSP